MSEENQSAPSDTQNPSQPESTTATPQPPQPQPQPTTTTDVIVSNNTNEITATAGNDNDNASGDGPVDTHQPIEARQQTLSPVSPSPRHIAEPSEIPVLKNQMDPTFNSAEAHPYLAQSNGAETPKQSQVPSSLDLAQHFAQQFNHHHQAQQAEASSIQQQNQQAQQQEQSQQRQQFDPSNLTSQATSSLLEALTRSGVNLTGDPAAVPITIANPTTTSAAEQGPPLSANNTPSTPQHGNASGATSQAEDNSNGGIKSPTSSTTSPNADNNPAAGVGASGAQNLSSSNPPSLPTTIPSNVDLQALLTKLSPAASGAPTPITPTSFNMSQTQPGAPGMQTPVQTSGTPVPGSAGSAPGTATGTPIQSNFQNHQQQPSISSPTRANDDGRSSINKNRPVPLPTNHPLPPNPLVSSSVPGHPPSAYPASLPPPPTFAQHRHNHSHSSAGGHDGADDDEEPAPFTVDEEEEFARFLADERDYVTQGQWDRFPPGSRLFIGNLPTEKVTKRDLFRLFHRHGRLAQISIKQAYGFIQFLDQDSCAAALRREQGALIRGRKMHLEISKPQRNTRSSAADSSSRRRSRSPDYRSSSPRRPSHSTRRDPPVDRYRSAPTRDYPRDRSPPRYPTRRDDYRPSRRSRSRSRSPLRGYSRRSPTPDLDDVPLPRRQPGTVPDVQILVSDELDRNFIWWVEQAFRQRGLKVDMLFLNPRLRMEAVVKRQVVEGVQAVVFLRREHQQGNCCTVQVFDRRGEGEATFDQYDNLDPSIAAELVVRSKAAHAAHNPVPANPYNPYGAAPAAPAPPAMPNLAILQQLSAIPNIAGLLGTLDQNGLQQLLAGLQAQQPQQPQQQQHNPYAQQQVDPNVMRMLGQQATPQPPPPQQQQYGQQAGNSAANNAMASFGGTNGLANLLSQASAKLGQQQAQQQQQQQNQQQQGQQGAQQAGANPGAGLGNIMETLAKWKQS